MGSEAAPGTADEDDDSFWAAYEDGVALSQSATWAQRRLSDAEIDEEVENLLEPLPRRRVRLAPVGLGGPRARASPALTLTLLERWRARLGHAANATVTTSSTAV